MSEALRGATAWLAHMIKLWWLQRQARGTGTPRSSWNCHRWCGYRLHPLAGGDLRRRWSDDGECQWSRVVLLLSRSWWRCAARRAARGCWPRQLAWSALLRCRVHSRGADRGGAGRASTTDGCCGLSRRDGRAVIVAAIVVLGCESKQKFQSAGADQELSLPAAPRCPR